MTMLEPNRPGDDIKSAMLPLTPFGKSGPGTFSRCMNLFMCGPSKARRATKQRLRMGVNIINASVLWVNKFVNE